MRVSGGSAECARLDGVLGAIRRGESRSLVLRGESGMGKTTLLQHLVQEGQDVAVVRARGVESEMELAFAGLHRLCLPLLDRRARLPAPQREALDIVFGRRVGAPPGHFLVGLALLGLLCDAAAERPVLCVIDDAQWLDRSSASAVAFAARRLSAEPVGMVIATREVSDHLHDLPQLELRPGCTSPAQPDAVAVVAHAQHVRALAALGRGDFEGAYQSAAAVSPPGTVPSNGAQSLWLALDLVEAAVRTGRHVEALAHVEALRTLRVGDVSPRLALMLAASEALVAPVDQMSRRFDVALTIPHADRWPFELARTHLLYGEHLRRTGAMREARVQLQAALVGLERLAARPWAQRASDELRATGLRRSSARELGGQRLTPQELHIASLAATGLSNKQIGARLYLSPRTVGGHLYRVFPKLGVTSRAGLRDALDLLEPVSDAR